MRIIGRRRYPVKRWREGLACMDTILFNLNGILFMRVSDRQPETGNIVFRLPFIRNYATNPLCRSNASMLGSRPRKALKFSIALRLPPMLMISFQNFAPIARTSPLSSNAA